MYPEFHMQSIRSHNRVRVFISCRGIPLNPMFPEAPRIKVYNPFRDLIPRNRIRISFRDSFQPRAHSVPSGPVRLNTGAENVGASRLLVERGVKAKPIPGSICCLGIGLTLSAISSRSKQVFDVLETQGR